MSSEIVVVVGSANPVKMDASIDGIASSLQIDKQSISSMGINVKSGVPDQPIGDKETKQGAINRARAAFDVYMDDHLKKPTYAVGLEGGVSYCENGGLECFAWIAIYDGVRLGTARTGAFELPPQVTQHVRDGLELGQADDLVFGSSNNKQKGGAVGHLTKGVMNRAEYYKHAVILAFIPFQWPELYQTLNK